MAQTQLTARSSENPVKAAAISPDGRYLAYADFDGLYLEVIASGETHALSAPPQFRGDHLAWFPDGTKVVASGVGARTNMPAAWAVSVLGGEPRRLRNNALQAFVSPDGSQVAFVTAGLQELWLMGPAGEDARRVLASVGGDTFRLRGWYPSGRRLLYFRYGPDGRLGSYELLDLATGRSTTLLRNVPERGMCALPDGRLLYAVPEGYLGRSGEGLWELTTDLRTGRPRGQPLKITDWVGWGLWEFSTTADGKRAVFLRQGTEPDVDVAELEPGGKRLRNIRRLTLDDFDDYPHAWTPDSKAVIFESNRNGNFHLYKQDVDQRAAETIIATPGAQVFPRLTPDGAWILYALYSQPESAKGEVRLMRVPSSGGAPETVLAGERFDNFRCPFTKERPCVLKETDHTQFVFFALDPVKGKGQEVARVQFDPSRFYDWDLSPQGSRLALVDGDEGEGRIHILALGEKAAGVHDLVVKGWARLRDVNWSADGSAWFVSSQLSGGGSTLLHVDPDGHATTLFTQSGGGSCWAVPSPDGRRVAFVVWEEVGNAWMIEGF